MSCLICGAPSPRGRSRCPRHSRGKNLKPRPTTTQQGYGWDHQQDRDRKLKQLIPGSPCPICRQGMYPTQGLDLHHLMPKARGGADHDTNRALAHARCNRSVQDRVGGAPRPSKR